MDFSEPKSGLSVNCRQNTNFIKNSIKPNPFIDLYLIKLLHNIYKVN